MVFQLHKDPATIGRTIVTAVGLYAAYKWSERYGPRTAQFDVCSGQKDFAVKLKSEADKRDIRGYVLEYSDCCARGEFLGQRTPFVEVKTWIAENSTPAAGNQSHFVKEEKCDRYLVKHFLINPEESAIKRVQNKL